MVRAKKLTLTVALLVVATAIAMIFAVAVPGRIDVANAEIVEYTITVTDGKSGSSSEIKVGGGENYTLYLPSHTGYYMSSLIVDGSELVEAIYSETPQIDNIHYIADGQYYFENVTAAHTVYVGFTAKQYQVTFDVAGGNGGNFSRWLSTDEEILIDTPVKKGYTFKFWSRDGVNAFDMIMPAESVSLTAIWDPAPDTPYTVRFYKQSLSLDDYEEVEDDAIALQGATGSVASYTPDPYKYDRFDYRSDLTNTSVEITADGEAEISVYYSRGEVVIYFDSTGGTHVESIAAMPGDPISAPASIPTKVGYTFQAWYQVNRPSAYTFSTMPGEDLYLEAHWKALDGIGYTVKFFKQVAGSLGYTEEKDDCITDLTGTAGSLVTYEPSATMYEDYSVLRTKSTLSAILEGDGSTVLSVYYERSKYTVTMNPGKGELEDSIRTTHFGEDVSYPTPTRTGYEFAGWYYNGTRIIDGAYPFHKSVTLEAKWNAEEYTVTFNCAGGSEVASVHVSYGGGVTRPETDPTRLNYTFGGWYLDEACTEEVNFNKLSITADTIIYAKWEVNTGAMLAVCGVMFVLLSLAGVVVASIVRKH